MHNEVAKMSVDIPLLSVKGYIAAMHDWCLASLTGIKDRLKKARYAYTSEVVKVNTEDA